MSNRATLPLSHPVAQQVARIRAELADLSETALWSMTPDETARTLAETTRLSAQAAGLELRLAAHADRTEVGTAQGATSTAAYWAHETHLTQRDAASRMKLAKALQTQDHEPVEDALARGDVLADQAKAIVEAVDALPDDVGTAIKTQARDHLLAEAEHFDAIRLRILGKQVLDVVAPEVGEAEEARQLEAQEAKARAKARFTMHDDGHGTTYGRFSMPTHEADKLRKPLNALASPKAGGEGSTPHGMGLAFIEYVDRYPVETLPKAAGMDATVVVTMTLETLMGGLKAAQLDTGTRISPSLARRMACEAGVIPVVLGGRSQVLDVGRKRRFHTKAQRIAMAVRDGGCIALGCDRPSAWCHAHHLDPWSQGGDTSVERGAMLCARHHTLIHHPGYGVTHHEGGKVSFHKRE
ncbi:HNH endonuclease signature motif containing protein [Nocardioides lijunqiniae]|uniref:HNH endonuclease signature motif containing protein n=1 Tax=Nocardioides lijunqiniae TaxID=2760832 RepID=UPI0018782849|nr:HNH endonuclease signature motif containing protein [Nocardioides lijunqiniae]